ncbi:MAG: hypothetical protein KAJ18_00175 [Candidatus Omnitrophica bacterium]|nr:hypothetical protein [Candidatus Omnitrophota bacterium]
MDAKQKIKDIYKKLKNVHEAIGYVKESGVLFVLLLAYFGVSFNKTISVNGILLLLCLIILSIILTYLLCKNAKLSDSERKLYEYLVSEIEEFDLPNWEAWMSNILTPYQFLKCDRSEHIQNFRKNVEKFNYPRKFKKIELTIKNLAKTLFSLREKLLEHGELKSDCIQGQKFYKIRLHEQKKYDELAKEYEVWTEECDQLIYESNKALNWLVEIIRSDFDPTFYIEEGRFSLTVQEGLSYRTVWFEYTREEKNKLLLNEKK